MASLFHVHIRISFGFGFKERAISVLDAVQTDHNPQDTKTGAIKDVISRLVEIR